MEQKQPHHQNSPPLTDNQIIQDSLTLAGIEQLEDQPEPQEGHDYLNRERKKRGSDSCRNRYKIICGCGLTYSGPSPLNYHIKAKHNGVAPAGTVCERIKCDQYQTRSFDSQTARSTVHRQNFVCKCGSSYGSKTALNFYIKQKHSFNNQQYTCDQISVQKQAGIQKQQKMSKHDDDKLIDNQQTIATSNYKDNHQSEIDQENGKQAIYDEQYLLLNQLDNQSNSQSNSPSNHNQLTNQSSGYGYEYSGSFGPRKKRRRRDINDHKDYVTRKIHFCGQCQCVFNFNEQLLVHIGKFHKGETPDGTIYGFKKENLLQRFKIQYYKPGPYYPKEKQIHKCGCGMNFSCVSSMIDHIGKVHQGKEPIGTIGCRRKMVSLGRSSF